MRLIESEGHPGIAPLCHAGCGRAAVIWYRAKHDLLLCEFHAKQVARDLLGNLCYLAGDRDGRNEFSCRPISLPAAIHMIKRFSGE